MDRRCAQTPEWVDWDRNPHRRQQADVVDVAAQDTLPETTTIPEEEYIPMGHRAINPDGNICKCGSNTHLQISSHNCPLNARWRGDDNRLQVGTRAYCT